MAEQTKIDFLRFSAYSIKDLITRKLTEDARFTDQVYEGSNLAILIDIVSYMYQCLIYNINNAASESMFSDTQIYENISRLCKFIGYHPAGYKPAQMRAYVNILQSVGTVNIYPCTAIDTNLYDKNGNKIYFSTVFNNDTNELKDGYSVDSSSTQSILLVNGRWKKYSTEFTANGLDFETFILDGLESNSELDKYVGNNRIQVFVKSQNPLVESQWWHCDQNELFLQAYQSMTNDTPDSSANFGVLYHNNDPVYTAYLNENKVYEIKFGNGIIGQRLNKGDTVYVFYLDTNGPDGYVDLSQIDESTLKFVHTKNFFGLTDEEYELMFGKAALDPEKNIGSTEFKDKSNAYKITFDKNSLTKPIQEEDVNSVRNTAPDWFKMGNRLITKKDYEYFIKSYGEVFQGVTDVKCMNNWDYMTTFYRWLFNLGIQPPNAENMQDFQPNPYKYLAKSRLVQAGYEYVDAADANNIYLWIKTSSVSGSTNMDTIKKNLNKQIANIKTMTTETYPLEPINVHFDVTFTPIDEYTRLISSGNVDSDKDNSYLEVVVSDNTTYSTVQIINQIEQFIVDAFNPMSCKFGEPLMYDTILEKIYGINGVERVRTVYYPNFSSANAIADYQARACDGIAFASWSDTPLIDIGCDLQIGNTNRVLEAFQFPMLDAAAKENLHSKIKIIKRQMNTTSPIKF